MAAISRERVIPGRGDALIVVDVQNDFLPGGSLAVAHGDEVIGPLNRYLDAFRSCTVPVFATRDWHPEHHCSFHAQGGPWPPHCIAHTTGAEFSRELKLPPHVTIVSKAMSADRDAYSGFEDTDLDVKLRHAGIQRLFVGGLATDCRVLSTVRDAIRNGFDVYLLEDAVRSVDVKPGDGTRAEQEMRQLGAKPVTLEQLDS